MKLILFKNDDFKNTGIEVTETCYEDGKKKEFNVCLYGSLAGWSKEVEMTPSNWECIKRIMELKKELAFYQSFQWDFFEVLKENDLLNARKGYKMQRIDDKVNYIKECIEWALDSIK